MKHTLPPDKPSMCDRNRKGLVLVEVGSWVLGDSQVLGIL